MTVLCHNVFSGHKISEYILKTENTVRVITSKHFALLCYRDNSRYFQYTNVISFDRPQAHDTQDALTYFEYIKCNNSRIECRKLGTARFSIG